MQTEAERDSLAEYMADISHQLKTPITSMMIMMDLLEDAKTIAFAPQKIKVSELIRSVMPSIEILLDVNNQSVVIAQDVEIICDRRWTIEALTNIIKNAMEHSPKGGSVTIDSGVNPMYEWISVTDSGMGLAKEQYAALFRRFENSTNENGYGIGMPLALSIMKGQNGDIDVELGGNGKGATFLLKFFK